jgi:O-acetyl-ADP-ribose deacetylase
MISVVLGDITKLEVDAIVNAANTSLLGGSGVDGAIHRAAGSELVHECQLLGGCKIGDAKLTKGYRLPARFVIHTVGPVWQGGNHRESEILHQCYRKCLTIAAKENLKTVAFPCISTGIYGYPKKLAAKVAISECQFFLLSNSVLIEIIFCCYDNENYEIYQNILSEANTN